MTRYHGGEEVKAGFYWNPAGWEITTTKKGATLPGPKGTRYLRIPTILLMVVGPVLGALMVVFLPLIGFVMLFGFAGVKLMHLVRHAVAPMAEAEAVHRNR